MSNSPAKLTKKQEAFIYEYIKDYNATQAAIRAGYSHRRASEIGYQLLRKTTVSSAVQALQDDIKRTLRWQFVNDARLARKFCTK